MKYPLVCLLALAFAACNPLPKIEDADEATPAPRNKSVASKAALTPTPVPKPGAWMEKKKIGNRLGVKEGGLKKDGLKVNGDRLDEKPAK